MFQLCASQIVLGDFGHFSSYTFWHKPLIQDYKDLRKIYSNLCIFTCNKVLFHYSNYQNCTNRVTRLSKMIRLTAPAVIWPYRSCCFTLRASLEAQQDSRVALAAAEGRRITLFWQKNEKNGNFPDKPAFSLMKELSQVKTNYIS